MRSYETPRELSYESFIETFGKEPISTTTAVADCKPVANRRKSMFVRPKEVAVTLLRTQGTKLASTVQEDTENNNVCHQESDKKVGVSTQKESRTERMSRKLRKFSLRKINSTKSTDPKKAPTPLHRSKSVSFLAKSSATSTLLSAFSTTPRSRKSSMAVLDSIEPPMSKMTSAAAHKGFLSKKNQKRQSWTRYWCILQDSCLYCYSSENAEFADDVIALGGYTFTNISKHITLERVGKETYQFKADDDTSKSAWETFLAKTLGTATKRTHTKLRRSASSNQPQRKKLAPVYERSASDCCIDVAEVKAKLLEEVLAQQQEIIREQKMLAQMSISRPTSLTSSPEICQKPVKTGSASLTAQESEDHGYCSSLDGSMNESFSEDSRQNSPSTRSYRSMSTVSVASSTSLSSIAEERRTSTDVCPKLLAEIDEFRTFSEMKRSQSKDM